MSTETAGPQPVLTDGVQLTYFLVVSDQDRSRDWWVDVFGAAVLQERDPVLLSVWGAVLILNLPGGPTADKPNVVLELPAANRTSAFLNVRVPDVAAFHHATAARGAAWLTPPIDRGPEIRGYIRDPDGHLLEVGQSNG